MKKIISIAMVLALMLSVMAIVPASAAKTDNAVTAAAEEDIAVTTAGGNSLETATAVTFGTPYSGVMTSGDASDFYKLTLPTSGKLAFNITAYIERTEYTIYDASGNELWRSLGNWWNGTSKVLVYNPQIDLTSGTYYFLMTSTWGNQSGNYNLKINFTSANETFKEYQGGSNNTFDTANTITMDHQYIGQLAKNDKHDFYKFTLAGSGTVKWDISTRAARTDFALYDENYAQIWNREGNYPSSTTGMMVYTTDFFLTSGTYYLQVFSYSDYVDIDLGSYTFSVKYTSADESFKETTGGTNNDYFTANPVALSKTYKGQIAFNDNSDYYRFTVSGKKTITLKSVSYNEYLRYRIIDSSYNNVWQPRYNDYTTNSGIKSYNASIELTSGTYYLLITNDSSSMNGRSNYGNYNFSLLDASIPSAIQLSKTTASLIKGAKLNLTATITPSSANKTVTWTSSAPSVASVSSGTVTAKAPGSAVITATTSNGLNATCTVTVRLATPRITKFENTASGIKLTWGKVFGAAKYRVFVKTSKGWTKLADTTATSYTYKKAKSGTKYTFTVRCMNAKATAATSSFNAAGWKTTFVSAPALPTLKNTKSGVQISWKKPAGAVKFRIFRKIGSGSWKYLADTTATKYVDKSAKKGVTYSYTIRCISANSKSYTSAYNTTGRKIKCAR